MSYLNCDGVEGINVDRTPQHALKEDDEDSDPEQGQSGRWFTGQEGEGWREGGEAELCMPLYTCACSSVNTPHLYNRQYSRNT